MILQAFFNALHALGSLPLPLQLGLVGCIIAAGLVLIKQYLKRQHHDQLPRGYSTHKVIADSAMPKHKEIHRDIYAKSKVPSEIDVILIGSGIGSLACAGLLAKAGKRCLVLEKHYIAGGSTHAFEDKGYEFDTGIHYIGNVHKRSKFLDLITTQPIEWDQMGQLPHDIDKAYDELRIGDKSYFLNAGFDNFVDSIAKHFPEERENIVAWMKHCQEISHKDVFFGLKIIRPKWLATLLNHVLGAQFFKATQRTAVEVARDFTSNPELIAALTGQFGDYGRSPSKESFFLHASVANHYLKGGFYPRGGSTVIAKGIIPVIERTGGRVLVKQGVERVLLDGGQAVGVVMDNGDEIRAPIVVSGAGVFNTYERLLPLEVVPQAISDKINTIGPSCSMVYLFVGMEGTPDELKLRSSNIWHHPSTDYDQTIEDFFADPEEGPMPLFIGFPCAKDSTWTTRFPGKANAVILTMCPYEWWEPWSDTNQGKRGEEYEAKKDLFKKRILEGLYSYYPQCKGRVDYAEVGSSLTFNHYINSLRGEVYGLEGHPLRFQKDDWLRPETHIPGFYMTGQDVTTLGVTGALMAGVLTAHCVLGYGNVVDLLSGRNLIEDLWHVEGKKEKVKKLT